MTVTNANTGVTGPREIDVVVAAADAVDPGERKMRAVGEAKVRKPFTMRHVRRLEEARLALGGRAGNAKLLLFGSSFDEVVRAPSEERDDLEIVVLPPPHPSVERPSSPG